MNDETKEAREGRLAVKAAHRLINQACVKLVSETRSISHARRATLYARALVEASAQALAIACVVNKQTADESEKRIQDALDDMRQLFEQSLSMMRGYPSP